MKKPRALDLFCCEGGVSTGLVEAGFDVTGVDINPQPRYPYRFIQADAMTVPIDGYDFIWASPPCQRFTRKRPNNKPKDDHPDLIEPIRQRLIQAGVPYVIENVPGAPLITSLKLHGAMFGLPMHRVRWFESNMLLLAPSTRAYPRDGGSEGARRRRGLSGEPTFITMAGGFVGAPRARQALGMPWASRYGLAQCIPPQYAAFIGRQIISGCHA